MPRRAQRKPTRLTGKRGNPHGRGSASRADPAILNAWLDEAERRLAAYERGEIKAIPFEEVMRKARAKLR